MTSNRGGLHRVRPVTRSCCIQQIPVSASFQPCHVCHRVGRSVSLVTRPVRRVVPGVRWHKALSARSGGKVMLSSSLRLDRVSLVHLALIFFSCCPDVGLRQPQACSPKRCRATGSAMIGSLVSYAFVVLCQPCHINGRAGSGHVNCHWQM